MKYIHTPFDGYCLLFLYLILNNSTCVEVVYAMRDGNASLSVYVQKQTETSLIQLDLILDNY